jgi:hypothetical protein
MASSSWRVALILVVAFAATRTAFGQAPESSPIFTRINFSPAYVIATNPFTVSGAMPVGREVSAVPSLTVEIGRQTDGSEEWHHLYGLPAYGFGVSVGTAGNGVSRPLDAYTFFSWPFARLSDRVQVTTDFGMGISWNWKALDHRTNAYATVLGSNLNARIDWGFYLRYLATPQTSLYAGLDFTHRSNGGMRQPDQGINVIGPSVGVRYNLAPEHARQPARPEALFEPSWELVAGAAAGRKNVLDEVNNLHHDFGAMGATVGVQRHFYRYGKIALGTDLMYDGSTGARVVDIAADVVQTGSFGDRMSLGLYTGYEHVIGRFGAIFQVGYKVVNGSDDPGAGSLYERYGWRYHFNDAFWGTFAVRAIDDRKADALEFGFGYMFRR